MFYRLRGESRLKSRIRSFSVCIAFFYVMYVRFLYTYPVYIRLPFFCYYTTLFSYHCIPFLFIFFIIFFFFLRLLFFFLNLDYLKFVKKIRIYFFNIRGNGIIALFFGFIYFLFFFFIAFVIFVFCAWVGGDDGLPSFAFNALRISNRIWQGFFISSTIFNIIWFGWDLLYSVEFLPLFYHIFEVFCPVANFNLHSSKILSDFYLCVLHDLFCLCHDSRSLAFYHILNYDFFFVNPYNCFDFWFPWYKFHSAENYVYEQRTISEIFRIYLKTDLGWDLRMPYYCWFTLEWYKLPTAWK